MNTLDHNLTLASNLYRASAVVYLIDYFLMEPKPGIIPAMLTIIITILIARLISKGYKWVKWALLVIEGIFLPFYIYSLVKYAKFDWVVTVDAFVSVLQVTALIYLFLPCRPVIQNEDTDDHEEKITSPEL